MNREELIDKVFSIENEKDFKETAYKVFIFQYTNNKVYNQWCNLMGKTPKNVFSLEDIPFIPISFFKTQKVISFDERKITHFFKSSGTTKTETSRHLIQDISLYEKSFTNSFEQFYGKIEDYCFIALLPNYIEQGNSSLVYMIDNFISKSRYSQSGFYKDDMPFLAKTLEDCSNRNVPIVLFGVTYSLLDLVDYGIKKLRNTIVFETGGMKGRRKEIVREQLHKILSNGLGVEHIASEYGMCELFSQAYSKKDGIFYCPTQMKVLIRDINSPNYYVKGNKTGGINVIDLANIDSCSFIATDDLGKAYSDEAFTIEGRIDNSIIRGCNLLM